MFDYRGKHYAAGSGWKNYNNEQQNIYLAEMGNPWTMKSERVLLSEPQYPWELHGKVPVEWQKNTGEPPYLRINEGPQSLEKNGRLFIIYSANACWLDYNLGMLSYTGRGSLLNRNNWKKYPKPVFSQVPEESIYAPGINRFLNRPMERKTGFCTTPTPPPPMAAEPNGHRICKRFRGIKTAPPTWENPAASPWPCLREAPCPPVEVLRSNFPLMFQLVF